MSMLTTRNLPTVLDDIFNDWNGALKSNGGGKYSPNIALSKGEDSYQVTAFLPGATRENVQIEVKEGNLSISGKIEKEASDLKMVYSELPEYSEFHRSLRLDDHSFDIDRVQARMEHGVLTIVLPFSEAQKPRKIEVQ